MNNLAKSLAWGSKALGTNALQRLLFLGVVFHATGALSALYQDIYVFKGAPDGDTPVDGVVSDPQGRLYGTTEYGGTANEGTVYRLTPPTTKGGAWTEAILHSFSGPDGLLPLSRVTLGSDGSVYGTASVGGTGQRLGVVFKLANLPGWPLTVLHDFNNGLRGATPSEALVFGTDGLLYGTTPLFTNQNYATEGTIYSVSPNSGPGDYRLVHTFGRNNDGVLPVGLTKVPAGQIRGFSGFVGSAESPFENCHGRMRLSSRLPMAT